MGLQIETENKSNKGDATLSASINIKVEKAETVPATTQKDSTNTEDAAQLHKSVERLKLRDKRLRRLVAPHGKRFG